MTKNKKINKLKVGIVAFFVIVATTVGVLGRYIYNTAIEAYFSSKKFYFSSDILTTTNDDIYTFDNWGGVDTYEIRFDLYSYSNRLSKLDYDLNYTVTCESLNSDKITCTVGAADGGTTQDGTIYVANNNTSTVTIFVKNVEGATINKGETVKLKVTAKTQEPYQKEISRIFALYIKLSEGNTYEIVDAEGSEYAILKLVNRSTSGVPAILEFDPDELRLDLNDEIYRDNISVETTFDGKYVNKIKFNMIKESAKNVKFYKVDKLKNYSYPGNLENSAIEVSF